MRAYLEINGVSFSPWIKETGLTQSVALRQSRSVVTLDGTLVARSVRKRKLHVELSQIRDDTWKTLRAALTPSVYAGYLDEETGSRTGVAFYLTGPNVPAKKVIGGVTFYTNVTFELEER